MFKNKLPSSSDYVTLDFLRFFSAYGIVIYHYQQELKSEFLSSFFLTFTSHFNLLVDLFFVISGFIISFVYLGKINNTSEYFLFMKKRFARLWPLHVIILLCYVGIWFGAIYLNHPPRNPAKYNFDCFMPHLLMMHALNTCNGVAFNYVSWSISAELFMYFLAPLLFFFARFNSLVILAISALSTLALYLLGGIDPYTHWTTSWGVLRAFPAFTFGIFLFTIRDHLKTIYNPRFLLILLLSSFLILPIFSTKFSDYFILLLVYAIVASAVAVDLTGKAGKFIRKLAPFGHLTYSLYMLHPLLQTVLFSFIASALFSTNKTMSDIIVFTMLPILLFISHISFIHIETPLRKNISQFKISAFKMARGGRGGDV